MTNRDWTNTEAIAIWLSARPTRNPILEVMRDSFDSGDSWGSVLAWHFAIADVVYEIEGHTPDSWEFTPSPFGAETDCYEYEAIIEVVEELGGSGPSLDYLIHAGNVLQRYASQLRLAGEDY